MVALDMVVLDGEGVVANDSEGARVEACGQSTIGSLSRLTTKGRGGPLG